MRDYHLRVPPLPLPHRALPARDPGAADALALGPGGRCGEGAGERTDGVGVEEHGKFLFLLLFLVFECGEGRADFWD